MGKAQAKSSGLKASGYFSYRLKDLIALVVIIACWAGANILFQPMNILPRFILSFAIMAFFVTFSALLIRKFGVVLLLFLLAVTAISSLPDLTGLGIKAYVVMFIAGSVFELMYLIFYTEIKVIPFDVIFSVVIALASVPLSTGLLLSPALVNLRLAEIINLMLLDFFIALIAAMVSFFFWFNIRVSKFILKFEYAS